MFRFAASNKVFWPVELATRGADGEPVTAVAYIGYKLLTRDELYARDRALMQSFTASTDQRFAAADELKISSEALLRERIVGWRDIVDSNDVPLPFTTEMLDAMLADPLLFNALLRGLFEASRGAREKNSLPGPGGAPAPAQSTATSGSGIAKTDGAPSPQITAATPASA